MNIDLNLYKNSTPSIRMIVANNPNRTIIELASISAVALGVPVIACCYYLGDILGMSKELSEHIDRLVYFYKVDKIIGK